ncbi:MAG: IPT/TIG domain-containing protein, partial [Terriglobia bacterium]
MLVLCLGWAKAQNYIVSTYAGGVPPPDTSAPLTASIGTVTGVATDPAGAAYFTSLNCVFKVSPSGALVRVAGTSTAGYTGDGGPAVKAQFSGPSGLAFDPAGNLFVADTDNDLIRRISPGGIITSIAGNRTEGPSGNGGPATAAQLFAPTAITVDNAGNIYFTEGGASVRVIRTNGIISAVAGNGTLTSSGDGGPAVNAGLNGARSLAIDAAGNLYVAELYRVRKISPGGIITTIAGTGKSGFSGDGGLATLAQFTILSGIAAEASGNLFVVDVGNHRIRKISADGIVTTLAGNGPGADAQVNAQKGIAVDRSGNVWIGDNAVLTRISPAGVIASVAGGGGASYSGDGGLATRAQFASPRQIALDRLGNLFIPDYNNLRVRRITPDGIVTTVAGTGSVSILGQDGLPATSTNLLFPLAVCTDVAGNLYISHAEGVARVSPDGILTNLAPNSYSATQIVPQGLAVDKQGNLLVAEGSFSRVRKISPAGVVTTVPARFGFPVSLAIDALGNMFVLDLDSPNGTNNGDAVVLKMDPAGTVTRVAGGGTVSGDGGPAVNAKLLLPTAIAVDGAGNIFIAEFPDIRRVAPDGTITTVAGNSSSYGYSGDGGLATSAEIGSPSGIAVAADGRIFVADGDNGAIRLLTPTSQVAAIGAVVDAASESAIPVAPRKIIAIYGVGLGPSPLVVGAPVNGAFGRQAGGTTVSVNGLPAPVIYSSAMQVAAIVPYATTGSSAQVTVSYRGQTTAPFTVPVVATSPSLFSLNGTGAGQVAAVNAADGSINDATHPVKVGDYISLYATGEGQTDPVGVDGLLAN